MRIKVVYFSLATLTAYAATAHADEEVSARLEPDLDTAVSVQLATLDTRGVSLQVERDLRWNRLSIAPAVGIRAAAMGDYGSYTLGAGVEARRWMGARTMHGLYLGVRTDFARTRVRLKMDDRPVGSVYTSSMGASAGYRFVFLRHIELTPSVGLALAAERGLGGDLPLNLRVAPVVSLTVGGLF